MSAYLGAALTQQRPLTRGQAIAELRREQAREYRPTSAAPCCAQAKRERCVCVARWSCPVHGNHCFGSHD